jgi:hypothetical protein
VRFYADPVMFCLDSSEAAGREITANSSAGKSFDCQHGASSLSNGLSKY